MIQKRTGLLIILILIYCLCGNVIAQPISKQEVLEKYEHVIVKSNQMNVYGFDLREVTFKLKRATEVLVSNQFDQAYELLEEIEGDLETIQARGPERLKREQRLAWLEVFGDFVQQCAIFIVLSLILIRFNAVQAGILRRILPITDRWKLSVLFAAAAVLGAVIGLIRYGRSSWAFVDLQVVFVGLGGLVGGWWVGMIPALMNGIFRLFVVPGLSFYFLIPVIVGIFSGLYGKFYFRKPLVPWHAFLGGVGIGLIHSLAMYLPIIRYLPISSFLLAVLSLSLAEGLLVFIFFVGAWQILKEQKRKETERELYRTRLQFLQAQINPHFLFNTLNTIASVCGAERAERARQLIVELSKIFRRITKQESDLVSLKDELDYIDSYLNIEHARFGERLQVEKKIALPHEALQTLVPILVLQPIVENAVKHGLSKKSEGGKIMIGIREENSKVVIEIQDTGIGMNAETLKRVFQMRQSDRQGHDENHAGIGLGNIRERLNKVYGQKCQMTISSIPNQGTTVVVSIPKGS